MPRPAISFRLILSACICCAAGHALQIQSAHAVDFTWLNADGVWSDGAQWQGGTAPPGFSIDDVLIFGGSGSALYTSTNDITNPPFNLFSLNQLQLNSTSSATNAIIGGTLQFGGASPQMRQDGSGAFTINNPLSFPSTTGLAGNGAGLVTLGGVISSLGGLDKSGDSTFVLGAANEYSGETLVQGGVLRITADQALGFISAGTSVGAGATLQLANVDYTIAEALSIIGSGVAGSGSLSSTGASSFAGAITVVSGASIGATGALSLTGPISTSGSILTFTGGGTITSNGGISGAASNSDLVVNGATLVLSGANTFNGRIVVSNSGTLRLGAAGALPAAPLAPLRLIGAASTFDLSGINGSIARLAGDGVVTNSAAGPSTLTIGASAGPPLSFSGVISNGVGGLSLVKDGIGIQVLSGANTYVGGTTINGGAIRVVGGGTLGANVAGNNVVVNPGGVLRLGVNNLGNLQSLQATSDATALAVIGLGFDANPLQGVGSGGVAASGIQSSTGGVLALSGVNNFATNVDFTTLGNGQWFLGATELGGTFTGATLTPGAGGVYRLGGGGGALTIANGNVLGGTNSVLVGAPLVNGVGTVTIAANQSYAGGTTIQAGGTLQTNQQNGLGDVSGTVTLDGGQLNLRGDVAWAMGGGVGYNIAVTGEPGTRSTIDVRPDALTNSSINLSFSSLTIGEQVLALTGANSYGLALNGVTTLGGNVVFDMAAANLTLAGQVTDLGNNFSITSRGVGGTLFLTNTDADAPNTFGALTINQGSVQADNATAGANALGNATITLNGGSLQLRHDGNNTTTGDESLLFGNDVIVTGANGAIIVNRIGTVATTKTLELGSLTIGDQTLTIDDANSYSLAINGNVSFSRAPSFTVSANTVFRGDIVDTGPGYTLNKGGSSALYIDSANTTFRGGAVINSGTVLFADLSGGATSYNTTATLGTGNVTINPGASVRFNALTNVNAGQTYNFVSAPNTLSRADLRNDMNPSDLGLRSMTAGVLALNVTTYATPLDLAAFGNGAWALGAVGSSTYTSTTLGVGREGVYRLAGGGSTLTLNQANVLTGNTSLEIGRAVFNGAIVGNSTGTVVLTQSQDFTGVTVVNVGSTSTIGNTLEFRGTLASPQIVVSGRLTANVNGTFVNADNTGNTNDVLIRPGGALRLSYTSTASGASVNKWHDTTPITLNGSALELIGRNATNALTSEIVGDISFRGGSVVLVQESGTNAQAELITSQLTRVGQGTLTFTRGGASAANIGATVGNSVRFIDLAGGPTVTNGMVAPHFVNGTDSLFMTYGENGFASAAFTVTNNVAAFDAGANTGVDIVDATTNDKTIGATSNIYALRTNQDISGSQLNLHSGGLLTTGTVAINSDLFFGDGSTAVEGVVYNASTTTLSGSLTAASLTKFGNGRLIITNANPGITGTNVQVNGGVLQLQAAGAVGAGSITLGGSNLAATTLELRGNTGTTFTNEVILGVDLPLATITVDRVTSGSSQAHTIQGLTFNTNTLGGQTLIVGGANTFSLINSGTTTLNGAGFATLHTSSASVTLNGQVTGTAGLYKSGSSTSNTNNVLVLTAANDYSGGTILNAGILDVRAPTALGTGPITINGGTLNLRANSTSAIAAQPGNDMLIDGNAVLSFLRISGSGSITLTLGSTSSAITITNNPILSVSNGSGVTAAIASPIGLTSNLTISNASTTNITSAITAVTPNAGFSLTKTGAGRLTLTSSSDSLYSGGTLIHEGVLRVSNANGRAGTGTISINPGGGFTMVNANNIDTAGGQAITLASNSSRSGYLGLGFAPAGGQSGITGAAGILPTANFLTPGQGGVLGIDATVNIAGGIDQSTLYDGNWYLGSTINGTYSSPILLPGNDDTYRLGGGGGTLTLLAANQNVLTGSAKVVIGKEYTTLGNGTVVINSTNDYFGGTVVTGSIIGSSSLYVRSGNNNLPLSTGPVNVRGNLIVDGAAGSLVLGLNGEGAGTFNANTIVFHPGALLRFDYGTVFSTAGATGGRWADAATIDLNGSTIDLRKTSGTAASISETVGALSFDRGSDVILTRGSSSSDLTLVAGSLARLGNGTLTIFAEAGSLGNTGAGSNRFLLLDAAFPVKNGIVAPFIVNRVEHQFVTYGANGFEVVDTTASNYVTVPGGAFGSTITNDGTEILSLQTASGTLENDLDVYALRTDRSILTSGDSADTITIRSGGLISASASTRRIDANLVFGSTGNGEALVYTAATTQLAGQITASSVTKFGAGVLQILTDQTGFSGNWTVNTGTLTATALGALGTGEVILNGGSSGGPLLTLNVNSGTPDPAAYSFSKVTAYNNNSIQFDPAVNDRVITIGDINLLSTGSEQHSGIRFLVARSRNTLNTGMVTLFDNYVINVDSSSFSYGASSEVVFGGLTGAGLTMTKMGDGRLVLPDISATFIDSTINLAGGTLVVTHNGSLGGGFAGVANVQYGAALDIRTADFTPTVASFNQLPGSIERWSVEDARGLSGTFTLQPGVNLQLGTNLLAGPRTIELDGGSVWGFLKSDDDSVAVYRTAGSDVSWTLLADSFIGQKLPVGVANFMDETKGPLTSPTQNLNTLNVTGALLELRARAEITFTNPRYAAVACSSTRHGNHVV